MAYIAVVVISPDGRAYDAEIDENAGDQAMLSDLVEMLNLPPNAEYNLGLINATRIREGVTIKIERVRPSSI